MFVGLEPSASRRLQPSLPCGPLCNMAVCFFKANRREATASLPLTSRPSFKRLAQALSGKSPFWQIQSQLIKDFNNIKKIPSPLPHN